MTYDKYYCVEKCQFGGRVYSVGDPLYSQVDPESKFFLKDNDFDPREKAPSGLIDADGTYYYPSFGYDDEKFPVSALNIDKNNTKLFQDLANSATGFPDNCTSSDVDSLHFTMQLTHSWEKNSAVYPHIHWKQSSDDHPLWLLTYRKYNNGDVVPEIWDTMELTNGVFPFAGSLTAQLSLGEPIDMTGMVLSGFIEGKISRVGASDSYAGDALLTEFDMHVKSDSNGSGQTMRK